jgi:hypothetical protein
MHGRLFKLEEWVMESLALDIEIVMVHDNQDSQTELELRKIVQRHKTPLLKLVSKQVNSPGLARNIGLEHVTGDWVTFWDSDDIPMPRMYKSMIEAAERCGYEIAVGDFTISNAGGEMVGDFEACGSIINSVNSPGLWRYTFRRERIQKARFEKMKMGEDQLFLANLNLIDSQVFFFPKVVYNYKIGHQGRLSIDPAARRDLSKSISRFLEVQESQGFGNEFTTALLIRLSLTSLKIGSIRQKITAIWQLSKSFQSRKTRKLLIQVVRGI